MSRTSLFYVFILVSCFLLSGCDRLKMVDEIKIDVAANQKQIAELKNESISRLLQLSNVQIELEAAKIRIEALETALSKAGKSADNDIQTMSSSQLASLKESIAQCVQAVKKTEDPRHIDRGMQIVQKNEVFLNFDAYYNPSSGRVQNNNQFVDQSAVYAFNKCMSSQGWPLK